MRFIRFLFVGGLNTVFGFGAYALMLALGLHFTVAAAVSTVLGVLFNFVTTGRLVFGSRSAAALPRFIGVYAVLYLMNIAGIALLVSAGTTDLVAGFLMLPVAAIIGYLLNARFVFGGSQS